MKQITKSFNKGASEQKNLDRYEVFTKMDSIGAVIFLTKVREIEEEYEESGVIVFVIVDGIDTVCSNPECSCSGYCSV